jgi:hypothetical protein
MQYCRFIKPQRALWVNEGYHMKKQKQPEAEPPINNHSKQHDVSTWSASYDLPSSPQILKLSQIWSRRKAPLKWDDNKKNSCTPNPAKDELMCFDTERKYPRSYTYPPTTAQVVEYDMILYSHWVTIAYHVLHPDLLSCRYTSPSFCSHISLNTYVTCTWKTTHLVKFQHSNSSCNLGLTQPLNWWDQTHCKLPKWSKALSLEITIPHLLA